MGRKKKEIPKLKDHHIFIAIWAEWDSFELVCAGYNYTETLDQAMEIGKKKRLRGFRKQIEIEQIPLVVEE